MINLTPLREELAPLQKDTFYCPFTGFVKGLYPFLSADITLSISFKSRLNFAGTHDFRFVAREAKDGKFYWFDTAK